VLFNMALLRPMTRWYLERSPSWVRRQNDATSTDLLCCRIGVHPWFPILWMPFREAMSRAENISMACDFPILVIELSATILLSPFLKLTFCNFNLRVYQYRPIK
jgi:hypothetical protein